MKGLKVKGRAQRFLKVQGSAQMFLKVPEGSGKIQGRIRKESGKVKIGLREGSVKDPLYSFKIF